MKDFFRLKDPIRKLLIYIILINIMIPFLLIDGSFGEKIVVLIIIGIVCFIGIICVFQVYNYIDENTSEQDKQFTKNLRIDYNIYKARIWLAVLGTILFILGITGIILGITLSGVAISLGVYFGFFALYDSEQEKIDWKIIKKKDAEK